VPDNAGNVSGSSASALGAPGADEVDALAGVPGQDLAFIGTATNTPNRSGSVERVSVGAGPSFSKVTSFSAISKPGPLAYCPRAGSAASLQDVLLVVAEDSSGGTVYRVPDASASASPTVSESMSLPGTGMYEGQPALQVDCGSGTVLVASGGVGDGLSKSTDGGVSFTKLPLRTIDAIRAVALTPGNPQSILVGDASGIIQGSQDGGQTWTVLNNPNTGGLNLNTPAGGQLWDLVAPPAGGTPAPATSRSMSILDRGAALLARPSADLVAGPGEFSGNLVAPSPPQNAGLPSIGGVAILGQRLAASKGIWKGGSTSFTYQWRDCDRAGKNCRNIAGAKTSTHVLGGGDVSHTLRVVVSARNAGGLASATSAKTATVVGAPTISRVSLASRKFRAKQGTTLRLTLPVPATVTVILTQKESGRKVKGRCRANATTGRRCTLMVRKAKLTFRGAKGRNNLKFRPVKLSPGAYTATLTARSTASRTSKPVSFTFTIAKPKHK
jgi:hypothetical protein